MTPDSPGTLGKLAHRFEALPASWKAVIVAVGAFLLSEFVDWCSHDWLSRNVWEPFGTFVRWLAAEPIGTVGLVVAASLVLLALATSVRATAIGAALATRIKGPRQADIEKSRRLLDVAGDEIRKLSWWNDWGIERPQVARLALDDVDKARTEVARFGMVLGRLAEAIQEISQELLLSLQSDLGKLTRQSFYDSEIAPMKRAISVARQPGTEDPRVAFIAFYVRYVRFRAWIHQVTAAEKRVLMAYPAYPKWRDADTAFLRKLNELPTIPAMYEIQAVVHRDIGIPKDLQPPAESIDGSGLTVTRYGVKPESSPS